MSKMFAVKFKAKEVRASSDGNIITPRGAPHWLIQDTTGWVPATAVSADKGIPRDLLVFASRAKANAFMKQWRGHPWYVIPETWKVIPVEARYTRVFSHYVIKGKS